MLLWLLGCQLMMDGGSADEGSPSADVPVVALLTIDTWRRDHFGPTHTPHLWALAEQGERFVRAYSPMGLTTPAHATMLTGKAPWEHGVEANNHHGYALRSDVVVLPEMFDGWATGAFVSAYPAGPEGGMRRGWDVFDGPEEGERPGNVAVEKALEWLPNDRPALLWVHLYEPHGPYEGSGTNERARYAEEVRLADAMLAPLLERLQNRKAMALVTSDHGEVLDEERCSYQHERSISDHVLRIPLFRWGPGISAGENGALVSLRDVPVLLQGGVPPVRTHWMGQSGMCEADCAPGCAPAGLAGRDTLVAAEQGRWVRRPGRGVFSQGRPDVSLKNVLAEIPELQPPVNEANEAAKSLGYISP